MPFLSARKLLGLPIIREKSSAPFGTVEAVLINPDTMRTIGFLIGRAGTTKSQTFMPLDCVTAITDSAVQVVPKATRRPSPSSRIIGLSAWTTHPRFLVGFVHDFNFAWETGVIESFVIHQLIRTWRIPLEAVEKITPRALLIHNDTTIKLKITPFPAEP